ncbi:amphoterin-induced protein 3 isoform X2 [Syngnathoides biaculeatus]|nr:amphoterin-induced protein 3 isoform X2 [Syngnathoides biaculeatus]
MRAPLQGAAPWTCALVLLGCLQRIRSLRAGNSTREGGCLRAADILSCAGLGLDRVPEDVPAHAVTLDLSHNRLAALRGRSFQGLAHLRTVRLAHNRLSGIRPAAFRNSSGALLRHLDLSSNRLRAVEGAYFRDLPGLEELLLYDNLLVRVESDALAGLRSLRRLYLSHNRLQDFPFSSVREHSRLVLLDLSSNGLLRLPLENLTGLPGRLQQGLYLHANPLVCDCATYRMFRLWELRGYAAVADFRQNYTCLMYGVRGLAARFLPDFPQACNTTAVTPQSGGVSVNAGRPALLHCSTALTGKHVTFFWLSPHREYVAPPGNNGSLKVFANGSLEIPAARAEDSGVYRCVALDPVGRRNETQEVRVTVVTRHHGKNHESFNTGLTTLLGCAVSLMLVLVYLYLTPCRCPPRDEAGPESVLGPSPPPAEGPDHRVGANKHVVFREPIKEQHNGHAWPPSPPEADVRRDGAFPHAALVLP